MSTSNFSRNHPYAKTRGWVGPNRAAPGLPTISDAGGNEVVNASEIVFKGGTVTEPDDGVAEVTLGGLAQSSNSGGVGSGGAANAINMRNIATVDLIPGDVVVVDPADDSAVNTTAAASNIQLVGVVQAPIPRLGYGPVLFNGFTSIINTAGSVSRGQYALTSATAGKAGATAARVAGSFGEYLTGTNYPDFVAASANTSQEIPVTSLNITMPATIPAGRVLFLALWPQTDATNVTVSGWTRIGAEAGYYYFYKISEGDDTATATWSPAGVAVATVLLLHPNVSLASPVQSHDYDSTTAAAAVSGLSDAARYAIAGVRADVAAPSGGYVRLGGGTANYSSGSSLNIVQETSGATGACTFASAVTVGNLLISVMGGQNEDTIQMAVNSSGAVDSSWTDVALNASTDTPGASDKISLQAKVATDSSAGPFYNTDSGTGTSNLMYMFEVAGIGIANYEALQASGQTTSPIDIGTFASVGADDLVILAAIAKDTTGGYPSPAPSGSGYTQDIFTRIVNPYFWVAHRSGSGGAVDAEFTHIGDPAHYKWGVVAGHFVSGANSSAGTLAGLYIGHASTATSPFTVNQQNDGVFAVNLLADAKASALLYGPDLGSGSGVSAGSNSTNVAGFTGIGGTSVYAPAAHWHEGVYAVTASSSNTLQRPIVNLRPGSNVAFGLSDTDSNGAFDTLTISASVTGGGVANWTSDINESGTSFANFTSSGGTWASDGTTINQTNNAASYAYARHNTIFPLGFGVILEVEMQFPTTGQGTGANIQGGILLGFDGSNTLGIGTTLDRGTGKVGVEKQGSVSIRTINQTVNLDTYYKLRIVHMNELLSVYVDGTLKGNVHIVNTSGYIANADYVGLYTYGSSVKFRNFKLWTLSTGAPS